MKLLAPIAFALAVAACGPPSRCPNGKCIPLDGGATDGGPACGGSCRGAWPVCNRATNYCAVCTETEGCGGLYPACDATQNNGLGACMLCTATHGCAGGLPVCLIEGPSRRCVECLANSDCPFGACDPGRHVCTGLVADAGSDGGVDAGVDGGSRDGGSDGGTRDGGTDGGFIDGGCITHGPPVSCTMECDPGFVCESGRCVLNGGRGPVQVTLRWNTAEDVDLHVLEPLPGGGSCDVYYGNRTGSSCGAVGALDLDSNAGCGIDNVDIENVIYPPDAGAPSGTYEVRVDHWSNCAPATVYVPFEVEVRNNGVKTGMCGAFYSGGPGWNNHGGSGSGTTVMTFVVP